MKRAVFSLLTLGLVLFSTSVLAQIPRTINYQGMLSETSGQPVADGNYRLTFAFYDESNAVVWSEVHEQVFVGGGLFQVMLGTISPFSIPFDKPYFLGMQVGTDPELQPRISLASVAYAIRAEEANKIMGIFVSPTPEPNKLLPLDASGKFPASVISGGASGDFLNKNEPDTSTGTSSTAMLLIQNEGSGDGIQGVSSVVDKSGVYGRNSEGYGVYGGSTNGVGVAGASTNSNGVRGLSSGSGQAGVFGENNLSDGYGVSGKSTNGYGVRGLSSAGGTAGVLGENHHFSGIGVLGESDSYIGVYGMCNDGVGVHGRSVHGTGVYGEGYEEDGMYGISESGCGVSGYSGNSFGVKGNSPWGTAVYAEGTFAAAGTKSAEVKLKDGRLIRLFSEEATEVYFNDYGEGSLGNGRAHIELDPTFLQTVTVDARHPMKVFVQLNDDCQGVFVTNRTPTGFDVVELQSGTSDAHFTYRVVCKRKYYEDHRLATREQDNQHNKQVMETVWPEVIEKHKTAQERTKETPHERWK